MQERFLLYIDILGFSELVNKSPDSIRKIYEIVNDLNIYKHDSFQSIIFSDTILVYNKFKAENLSDSEYITMYLIEFAQDLLHRGKNNDINFRAVITQGEFEHYKLDNIECYYGKSLIYAYLNEKDINGIGVFIDKRLEKYNKIFKTCTYNENLDFVFVLQNIMSIKSLIGDCLPVPLDILEANCDYTWLKDEIFLLKKYYNNQHEHSVPKVRAKYLQTYQFYKSNIPSILEKLEKTDFSLHTINKEIDWDEY